MKSQAVLNYLKTHYRIYSSDIDTIGSSRFWRIYVSSKKNDFVGMENLFDTKKKKLVFKNWIYSGNDQYVIQEVRGLSSVGKRKVFKACMETKTAYFSLNICHLLVENYV